MILDDVLSIDNSIYMPMKTGKITPTLILPRQGGGNNGGACACLLSKPEVVISNNVRQLMKVF
jgi:hypothetical protein